MYIHIAGVSVSGLHGILRAKIILFPQHKQSLIQFHMSIQQKLQIKSAEDYLTRISPVIHFLETHPSLLRDVPWIELREHKVCMYKFTIECIWTGCL